MLHIARSEDWQEARTTGVYRRPAGIVYGCSAAQLGLVVRAHFPETEGWLVLTIDEARVDGEIRRVTCREGSRVETFPHLHGSVPLAAVTEVRPLEDALARSARLHADVTTAEFTRQAASFRASATLSAEPLTTRIGDALGERPGRLLDVACGPGLLLPTLAARAERVVGIDLTAENLRLAREAEGGAPISLVRGVAEVLPFASGSFDAAVLRLALHHVVDPAAVLGEVRRILCDTGRVVVLDVLGPEDPETATLRDAIERLRDPSHTALLSASAMVGALAQAGFRVDEPTLWSQTRAFEEWAAIMNEPRRMADLETVLRALAGGAEDPTGLQLEGGAGPLSFTYHWGLFVAERG